MGRVTTMPSSVDSLDEWVDTIHATIAGRGYALLPAMGQVEWQALVSRLGTIIDTTSVQLHPGINTYLSQPGEVPLHSDHPDAEWIAWRCECPDPNGTPQLLCDSHSLVASLGVDAHRALLRARVSARYRTGMAARPFPVLRESVGGSRLFFAPWLAPDSTEAAIQEAWRQLAEAASSSLGSCIRVLLRAGEVLIIDNHRMLHGRPPLLPHSPRRLRRFWLRLGR